MGEVKVNGHHLITAVKDERPVPPLGLSKTQFIEAAHTVINDIEQYYSNISSRVVLPSISPGYLRKLLPTSPPEHGEDFESIERDIERVIMPGITHWQHPKFMAFFPASSTYPGILAEMWSAALTAPAFNWICSPAVTELETIVLDWFAKMLHLPPDFHSSGPGGGVIQGSASEALVTCMVAARERYVRNVLSREDSTANDEETAEDRACAIRASLVALGSDQAHSSTRKAANIAGVRFRSIATQRCDNFALTGDALRNRISEIRARGLNPFFLTVTIGTTNTCAIDDLEAIAEVARENPDIWFHCDAAYAGVALILPQFAELSKRTEFLDSIDVNMHKWLLTNFDASALYVRARGELTAALGATPAYLANAYSASGLVTDYRDWQIPLGRRFRALKIWFVMRTFGAAGMRAHLQHHIQLGELFASLIRTRPDLFTILTQPAFALTVITVRPPHLKNASRDGNSESDLDATNAATRAVYEVIEKQKEFFLTSTVVGGVYAIRVVSANPLAEEKYVRQVFNALVEATEEVVQQKPDSTEVIDHSV